MSLSEDRRAGRPEKAYTLHVSWADFLDREDMKTPPEQRDSIRRNNSFGKNTIREFVNDVRQRNPVTEKMFTRIIDAYQLNRYLPEDPTTDGPVLGSQERSGYPLPEVDTRVRTPESAIDYEDVWRELAVRVRATSRTAAASYTMFTGPTVAADAGIALVARRYSHPVRQDEDLTPGLLPSQRDSHTFEDDHVTLGDVIEDARRTEGQPWIVVLGEPGLGKSTLLRRTALETEGTNVIPLLIEAKEWERFSRDEGSPSILSISRFLPSWILSRYNFRQMTDAEKALNRLVGSGRLLLLVDGLDEVRSQSAIADAIIKFAEFGQSSVVVTCRTSLDTGTLPSFMRTVLQPLSDSEIIKYVERRGERENAFWTPDLRDQFFAELHDGNRGERLAPLLGNGLALAMSLRLCEEGLLRDAQGNIRLVDSLVELYDLWTERLVFDPVTRFQRRDRYAPIPHGWLSDRNIPNDAADDIAVQGRFVTESRNLLTEFAFQTFVKQDRDSLNLRRDVVFEYSDGRPILSRDLMFDDIIETSGLLISKLPPGLGGPDAPVEFSHQTVQEYFAGRCLYNQFWLRVHGQGNCDWSTWLPPLNDQDAFCKLINDERAVPSPSNGGELPSLKSLLLDPNCRELILVFARWMPPRFQYDFVNLIRHGLLADKFTEAEAPYRTLTRTRNILRNLALTIAARSPHDYGAIIPDLLPVYWSLVDGPEDEIYFDAFIHQTLEELVSPRNPLNRKAAIRHYLSVLRSDAPPYAKVGPSLRALTVIGIGDPYTVAELFLIYGDSAFDEETRSAAMATIMRILYVSWRSPSHRRVLEPMLRGHDIQAPTVSDDY